MKQGVACDSIKKVKARGFYGAIGGKLAHPDGEESAWAEEQLRLLRVSGVPLQAEGTLPDDDAKWFRGYVKGHARPYPGVRLQGCRETA